MNTAIAVGVGLVVVAAACFYVGPAATVVLVTAILGFAAVEFFSATQRAGYHAVPIIGMVATASLPLAAYWRGESAIPLVMVLTVGTLIAWWLMDLSHERAIPNIGITLLGVVYIGVFGSYAALLLKLPNGIGLIVGAVVVTIAHDVGGLFLGQRFGTTQLSAASPNKTLEGFLLGIGSSTVAAAVILGMVGWHPWDLSSAALVGLIGGLAAAFGDLCESRLKRDLGVKDMGDILPGHGGVLDRFDGMLFVLPATYYVVLVLEVYLN